LHRRHQANTLRKRRVLSCFFLGRLILHSRDQALISNSAMRKELHELPLKIQSLTSFVTK
jgi:hypothetical protein